MPKTYFSVNDNSQPVMFSDSALTFVALLLAIQNSQLLMLRQKKNLFLLLGSPV